MSKDCYEVSPMSRSSLMELAAGLRTALRIEQPYFPILQVVELVLPRIQGFEEVFLSIGEMDEMGDDHGLTFPDTREIRLRKDVYDGVHNGKGRDRFTLAHELGHLLLHSKPGYARTLRDSSMVKPYRSSEWQANTFAGSLLMPIDYLQKTQNVFEIIDVCGVTIEAVQTHRRLLQKSGLLH